jgi:hypothetical protein
MKFGIIKTNIKIVNIKNHLHSDFDYYIGRPSVLSNPYSHLEKSIAKYKVDSRDIAIDKYEEYFKEKIKTDQKFIDELNKLIDFYLLNKQLNLCCWCYPKRCHGEIIKNYLEEQIRIQYENFNLR